MLTPLLLTLTLLGQAPTAPLTVLVNQPSTRGIPSHIASFSQEHVYEQLKEHGLVVVRTKDMMRQMPASKRRALTRCKHTEPSCLAALGNAAGVEAVMVVELIRFKKGEYRVGLKAYRASDGSRLEEHEVPGVGEDQMLDALTRCIDVVLPGTLQVLRPPPPPPPPAPASVVEAPSPAPATAPALSLESRPAPVAAPITAVETRPVASGAPGWAWVPAAGGAVFAGAGTYFLLQAAQQDRLLRGLEGTGPVDGAKVAAAGRDAQNLSRVAFGLGAAGVLTSTLLYVFSSSSAPVRPTASVSSGGAMVGVAGVLP